MAKQHRTRSVEPDNRPPPKSKVYGTASTQLAAGNTSRRATGGAINKSTNPSCTINNAPTNSSNMEALKDETAGGTSCSRSNHRKREDAGLGELLQRAFRTEKRWAGELGGGREGRLWRQKRMQRKISHRKRRRQLEVWKRDRNQEGSFTGWNLSSAVQQHRPHRTDRNTRNNYRYGIQEHVQDLHLQEGRSVNVDER
jgi:hypothetical protein